MSDITEGHMCASRSSSAASRSSSAGRAWLLLPVALGGIAISVVAIVALSSRPAHTVSEIRNQIREIALARSSDPDVEDGGPMGPWWVAATSADDLTGAFRDFRLTSGTLRLAAREARLVVDVEAASLRFELKDVVLTTVPNPREPEVHLMTKLESYVLGPIPLRGRVVRDDLRMPPRRLADAPRE